jgi:hypothetical protein
MNGPDCYKDVELLKSIENKTIDGLGEYIDIKERLLNFENTSKDNFGFGECRRFSILINDYVDDYDEIFKFTNTFLKNNSVVLNISSIKINCILDNNTLEGLQYDYKDRKPILVFQIYSKKKINNSIGHRTMGALFQNTNVTKLHLINIDKARINYYTICLNKMSNIITDVSLEEYCSTNINFITDSVSLLILKTYSAYSSRNCNYNNTSKHFLLPNSIKYFRTYDNTIIKIYPSKIKYLYASHYPFNKKLNNLKYMMLTNNNESEGSGDLSRSILPKMTVLEISLSNSDSYNYYGRSYIQVSKNILCDTLIIKSDYISSLDNSININIKNLIFIDKIKQSSTNRVSKKAIKKKNPNTCSLSLKLHSLSVMLYEHDDANERYNFSFPESKVKLLQSINASITTHKRTNIKPKVLFNSNKHKKISYSNDDKKHIDLIITFNGKIYTVKNKNDFSVVESIEEIKNIIENYFYKI